MRRRNAITRVGRSLKNAKIPVAAFHVPFSLFDTEFGIATELQCICQASSEMRPQKFAHSCRMHSTLQFKRTQTNVAADTTTPLHIFVQSETENLMHHTFFQFLYRLLCIRAPSRCKRSTVLVHFKSGCPLFLPSFLFSLFGCFHV